MRPTRKKHRLLREYPRNFPHEQRGTRYVTLKYKIYSRDVAVSLTAAPYISGASTPPLHTWISRVYEEDVILHPNVLLRINLSPAPLAIETVTASPTTTSK